jgi:hypothetical protein
MLDRLEITMEAPSAAALYEVTLKKTNEFLNKNFEEFQAILAKKSSGLDLLVANNNFCITAEWWGNLGHLAPYDVLNEYASEIIKIHQKFEMVLLLSETAAKLPIDLSTETKEEEKMTDTVKKKYLRQAQASLDQAKAILAISGEEEPDIAEIKAAALQAQQAFTALTSLAAIVHLNLVDKGN